MMLDSFSLSPLLSLSFVSRLMTIMHALPGTQAGGMLAKVKAAGHATDEFVHANPWKSISMAAGLGVILGLIASRR